MGNPVGNPDGDAGNQPISKVERTIARQAPITDAERRDRGDTEQTLRHRLPLGGDLSDDQAERERRHSEVMAA